MSRLPQALPRYRVGVGDALCPDRLAAAVTHAHRLGEKVLAPGLPLAAEVVLDLLRVILGDRLAWKASAGLVFACRHASMRFCAIAA